MKRDERRLLLAGAAWGPADQPPDWRSIAESIGMHPKRAWKILEKWTDRGWFEFGVSPFGGWLTEDGIKEACARAVEVLEESLTEAWGAPCSES